MGILARVMAAQERKAQAIVREHMARIDASLVPFASGRKGKKAGKLI